MIALMSRSEAFSELGLSHTASNSQIKSTYKKLARLHHPDIDPNGAQRMVRINAAYRRLTIEASEEDSVDKTQEDDPFAGFDGWKFDGPSKKIGKRIDLEIDVDWEVANLGGNQEITYKIRGGIKKITVKIPKHSATGKQIRVAGYGEPGADGGISGDLFVTLKVKGKTVDINTSISLQKFETKAGSNRYIDVVVDGKNKRITVPLPANVKNHQLIKIEGVGNRASSGDNFGDILVTVNVLPPRPGQDIETYAPIGVFAKLGLLIYGFTYVTLLDVNTKSIVYTNFKIEGWLVEGKKYHWDDLGHEGDPGARRGLLFVTPRYTAGVRHFWIVLYSPLIIVFLSFLSHLFLGW